MFRKEWRQQILVVGLVTVAVAVAVAGSSMAMSSQGAIQPGFGTAGAKAVLTVTEEQPASDLIAAAETRFGTVEAIGHAPVAVPGSSEPLDVRAQDPDGTFGRTMLRRVEGRYPTDVDEVALTRDTAALLAVAVGDQVDLGRVDRRVVGIVENPAQLDDDFALVAPDDGRSATSLTLLFERPGTDGASGGTTNRADRSDDPGPLSIPVMVRGNDGPIGALVLVAVALVMALVGLIAAAGFVVVAQRRQRQLGLLAAIGASQRHLRLVVTANGAIVGLIAAVVGTALGLIGWVFTAPAVEVAANHRIGRWDLPWAIVAGCALLAIAMSTIAAWWPARRISRIPVMAALSGRPPRPTAVHRSVAVALGLLLAGVVAIATAIPSRAHVKPLLLIGGVIAVAVGTVFAGPAALRIGAVPAARLPLAGRLALRDLDRFQARAAAALAAIAVVVGMSVTVVVIAGANQYRSDEGNLSSHQLLISLPGTGPDAEPTPELTDAQVADLDGAAADIATTIDGATLLTLDVAKPTTTTTGGAPARHEPISEARETSSRSWNHLSFPPIATPEILAHFGIDPDSIDPEAELLTSDTGKVVLLDVSTPNRPGGTKVQQVDLPKYTSAPRAVITEAALEHHGWTRTRSGWFIESPDSLTPEQIAAARKLAAASGLTIETRSSQDGLAALRMITTGVGALLALAIVAMTVGLIRSESARDLQTLTATGATGRTRRALTASTAGALAILGVVLGTIGAYAALLAGYHADLSRLLPVPWPPLLGLALGLPLLAFAAGWLLAGRDPKTFSRQTID